MPAICFGLLVMWCEPMQGAALDATSFCRTAQPIYWSRTDTRATKEQIDTHNRIGKRLCGWGR